MNINKVSPVHNVALIQGLGHQSKNKGKEKQGSKKGGKSFSDLFNEELGKLEFEDENGEKPKFNKRV